MKETDFLFGFSSMYKGKHFFMGDFDDVTKEELMDRVGKILFNKYKFGRVYLIKSGKGYHLISFSKLLSLKEYLKILKEMKADEKYIEWVERTGYGILRISRRSGHFKVPKLEAILISPYDSDEIKGSRNFYFLLLKLEERYKEVRRVVLND